MATKNKQRTATVGLPSGATSYLNSQKGLANGSSKFDVPYFVGFSSGVSNQSVPLSPSTSEHEDYSIANRKPKSPYFAKPFTATPSKSDSPRNSISVPSFARPSTAPIDVNRGQLASFSIGKTDSRSSLRGKAALLEAIKEELRALQGAIDSCNALSRTSSSGIASHSMPQDLRGLETQLAAFDLKIGENDASAHASAALVPAPLAELYSSKVATLLQSMAAYNGPVVVDAFAFPHKDVRAVRSASPSKPPQRSASTGLQPLQVVGHGALTRGSGGSMAACISAGAAALMETLAHGREAAEQSGVLRGEVAELKGRLDMTQQENTLLRTALSDFSANTSRPQSRVNMRTETRGQSAAATPPASFPSLFVSDQDTEALKRRLAELEAVEAKLKDVLASLDDVSGERDQARRERDSWQVEAKRLERQLSSRSSPSTHQSCQADDTAAVADAEGLRSKLGAAEAALAEAQRRERQYQAELHEQAARSSSLEQQLADVSAQQQQQLDLIERLQQELKESERRRKEMEAAQLGLVDPGDVEARLRAAHAEREAQWRQQSQHAEAEYRESLRALQAQIVELERQLAAATARAKSAEVQVSEGQSSAAQLHGEVESLRARMTQLEAEASAAAAARNCVQQEAANLAEELARACARAQEAEQAREALGQALEVEKQRAEGLATELSSAQQCVRELRTQVLQLQVAASQQEALLAELRSKLHEASHHQERYQLDAAAEREALTRAWEELRASQAALASDASVMKAMGVLVQAKTLKFDLGASGTPAGGPRPDTAAHMRLLQQVKELNNRLSQVNAQLDEKGRACEDAQTALSEAKAQLARDRGERERELDAARSVAAAVRTRLEADIEALKVQLRQQQQQAEEGRAASTDARRLQSTNAELMAAFSAMRTEATATEREARSQLTSLQTQLGNSETQLDRLRQDMLLLTAKLQEAERTIFKQDETIAGLQARLRAFEVEFVEMSSAFGENGHKTSAWVQLNVPRSSSLTSVNQPMSLPPSRAQDPTTTEILGSRASAGASPSMVQQLSSALRLGTASSSQSQWPGVMSRPSSASVVAYVQEPLPGTLSLRHQSGTRASRPQSAAPWTGSRHDSSPQQQQQLGNNFSLPTPTLPPVSQERATENLPPTTLMRIASTSNLGQASGSSSNNHKSAGDYGLPSNSIASRPTSAQPNALSTYRRLNVSNTQQPLEDFRSSVAAESRPARPASALSRTTLLLLSSHGNERNFDSEENVP